MFFVADRISTSPSIRPACPVVGALERCPPQQVVGLAKTLLNRFGVGAERQLANVYAASREPSKFDDHQED